RPMPEPAPVTIAVRPASLMSGFLSMRGPPMTQIGGGSGAAEPRAPAELFCHARDRQRCPVGWAMQVDRCYPPGIGQPTNEARVQRGKLLAPLQHRPFHAG